MRDFVIIYFVAALRDLFAYRNGNDASHMRIYWKFKLVFHMVG